MDDPDSYISQANSWRISEERMTSTATTTNNMGSLGSSNSTMSSGKACAPLTAASRLREMLKDPSKVVVCPGVFDGLTARLALAAGYDAMYMVRSHTRRSTA